MHERESYKQRWLDNETSFYSVHVCASTCSGGGLPCVEWVHVMRVQFLKLSITDAKMRDCVFWVVFGQYRLRCTFIIIRSPLRGTLDYNTLNPAAQIL